MIKELELTKLKNMQNSCIAVIMIRFQSMHLYEECCSWRIGVRLDSTILMQNKNLISESGRRKLFPFEWNDTHTGFGISCCIECLQKGVLEHTGVICCRYRFSPCAGILPNGFRLHISLPLNVRYYHTARNRLRLAIIFNRQTTLTIQIRHYTTAIFH